MLQAVRRAEMIERAAERGGRLAGQLLAYSRKQMLRPETISVYQIISATSELLAQAAGEDRAHPAGDRTGALEMPCRSRAARIGHSQPGAECARCDAGRREYHDPLPQPYGSPRLRPVRRRGLPAITFGSMSRIPAAGSHRSCGTKCSSHFLPPSRSDRAAGSVFRRSMDLPVNPAAGWIWKAASAAARPCRCSCRATGGAQPDCRRPTGRSGAGRAEPDRAGRRTRSRPSGDDLRNFGPRRLSASCGGERVRRPGASGVGLGRSICC